MTLTKKVAIVTGGERGIGRAIVKKLSEKGIIVISTDITCVPRKGDYNDQNSRCIVCDSSIKEEVQSATREIIKEFARVDILVNNAGVSIDSMLTVMEERAWDTVINTNLKGTFNWTQAVAPHMIAQLYGRIINISSIAYLGNRGTANYSASKAGINGFTRSTSLELAQYHITVNSVAPGVIGDTEMVRRLPEKVHNKLISRIPSGDTGTCMDIANCVSFLASDDARYINGQVIHVCGGLTVGYL